MHRFACRHLERDMLIDIDGNIRMCFQDLQKKHLQGNIIDESIETLWKRNENLFVEHTRGHYPDICKNCDEYYTCNA